MERKLDFTKNWSWIYWISESVLLGVNASVAVDACDYGSHNVTFVVPNSLRPLKYNIYCHTSFKLWTKKKNNAIFLYVKSRKYIINMTILQHKFIKHSRHKLILHPNTNIQRVLKIRYQLWSHIMWSAIETHTHTRNENNFLKDLKSNGLNIKDPHSNCWGCEAATTLGITTWEGTNLVTSCCVDREGSWESTPRNDIRSEESGVIPNLSGRKNLRG